MFKYMNITFGRIGNMHCCETQLTTVINDWTIKDRLTHLYWNLKRHLIHPLMSSLKANCLAMDIEMDRFFSMLQTIAGCFKRSKI